MVKNILKNNGFYINKVLKDFGKKNRCIVAKIIKIFRWLLLEITMAEEIISEEMREIIRLIMEIDLNLAPALLITRLSKESSG